MCDDEVKCAMVMGALMHGKEARDREPCRSHDRFLHQLGIIRVRCLLDQAACEEICDAFMIVERRHFGYICT